MVALGLEKHAPLYLNHKLGWLSWSSAGSGDTGGCEARKIAWTSHSLWPPRHQGGSQMDPDSS